METGGYREEVIRLEKEYNERYTIASEDQGMFINQSMSQMATRVTGYCDSIIVPDGQHL
jgi:hypothetical protein